jgi:hypothetical protein
MALETLNGEVVDGAGGDVFQEHRVSAAWTYEVLAARPDTAEDGPLPELHDHWCLVEVSAGRRYHNANCPIPREAPQWVPALQAPCDAKVVCIAEGVTLAPGWAAGQVG